MDLDLRAGQKLFIGGQNGSGKSVLATSVARRFSRVVVYDPKHDASADLPGAAEISTAAEVVKALPGKVLYRPADADMAQIAEKFDEICARVLLDARRGAGVTALVIHELADLATSSQIGPALRQVIAGGRSLGITVILVTQRPHGIPVIARSEAQHVACFTLIDPADLDYMAAVMGPAVRLRPLPLDHSFWYRSPDLALALCAPVRLT